MTSEIALMNRYAVTLAADSATTIQYWENGQRRERYFKGANKIFNLSGSHPVALMIFDASALQGVPWDVVAKSYREALGVTAYDHIEQYAKGFFEYIETNVHLYPLDFQTKQFIAYAMQSVYSLLSRAIDKDKLIAKEGDPDKKKQMATDAFDKASERIKNASFIGDLSESHRDKAIATYKATLVEEMQASGFFIDYTDVIDIGALADLAIEALLKHRYSILPTSGLVITGYGEKEYFPVLQTYTCYGLIMGKLLFERKDERKISQENVSEIVHLAQSSMSETFTYGIDTTALSEIERGLSEVIDGLHNDLRTADKLKDEQGMDELKEKAKESFNKTLTEKLYNSHAVPMQRVIGFLPVDELSELAEILVRMESLKERVTKDSEQVGGPIDVVVISKGDGFIWIKRKHYFDPKLNPRFFARRGMSTHG